MKARNLLLLSLIFLLVFSIQAEALQAADFFQLVRSGSVDEIRRALEEGADVNKRTERGETPLMLAAASNREPYVITLLLDYGAALEARDNRGRTALYLAARHNTNPAVLRNLVSRGAAVNIVTSDGTTPLMAALESSSREKFDILLRNGARVDQRDNQGRTILHLLVEKEADLDQIRSVVRAGAAVNAMNNQDRTPLHLAAARGQERVVAYLLEQRARVNTRDRDGVTPLMSAAASNRTTGILAKLLKAEAELEAVDNQQRTAFLHAALNNNNPAVLEYLAREGARVNAVDKSGKNALHLAITGRRPSRVIEQLLALDIEINRGDEDNNTPLHLALKPARPDTQTINLLLRGGADPNPLNKNRYTPLLLAAENTDSSEILQILIDAGAEVNPENTYRNLTPLMLAAANTSSEAVIFTLLEAGAEVQATDTGGRKVVDYLEENSDLFGTDAYWELQYLEPAERRIDLLDKKSSTEATLRSLAIPSLGHAYAGNWWPKGTLFLAGEVAALGMAVTRDSTEAALPYYLIFAALKVWEVLDVRQEISSFNQFAEEYNERAEEFNLRFQE